MNSNLPAQATGPSRPSVLRRGYRRLVRDTRRVLGQDVPSSGSKPPADPTREVRGTATRLWDSGDRETSLDVLRRALLEHPQDVKLWHSYASRMLRSKRPDVAVEANKNALELDPAHVGSLELLTVLAERPSAKLAGFRKSVLKELVPALALRPQRHRELVGFLIAERHRRALDELTTSPDPVVRLAVQLDATKRADWAPVLEGVDDQVAAQAQMHCLLGRGGASQAAGLLAAMAPDDIPVVPVRMALRRMLHAGQHDRAQALLRQYQRVRPDDGWAKIKQREVSKVMSVRIDATERRLLEEGFRFPDTGARGYEPRPDKVLYNVHNSLPFHSAGYATRTHGLLTALNERGWEVDAVTRIGYPYDLAGFAGHGPVPAVEELDGVAYRRLTTEPTIERRRPIDAFVGRYSTALQELARQERPALLHSASNHVNGLAAVSAARELGVPSIYEVRGLWEVTRGSRDEYWAQGDMYRFISQMEFDAADAATRVIAITGALRDELVRRGVDGEKISLVPNGVDTDRFVPRPRNEELAARLGVGDKLVVGYVGSILDYEGLGLLVEAAAALSAERSDFVVLVVGDGAERERLQQRVDRDGLAEVVRFLGRVPHEEVEDYYSIMDICPLPRLPLPVCEMVSPLKPFEAMAMGKVVLASDVAALAEIIDDGRNGMLHRKGSAESLADQLRVLLDEPGLRSSISEEARSWVVANRRWDVLSQRVSDIYQELGARPAQG